MIPRSRFPLTAEVQYIPIELSREKRAVLFERKVLFEVMTNVEDKFEAKIKFKMEKMCFRC